MKSDEFELAARGRTNGGDRLDDLTARFGFAERIEPHGMRSGDPGREMRDLRWIGAASRRGDHAGQRVREQARRVTVHFPERCFRVQINLGDRLRAQASDGFGLPACQRRVDRDASERAERRRTDDVSTPDAAAVVTVHDGIVLAALDRADGMLDEHLPAQCAGHGGGDALDTVLGRVTDRVLRRQRALRARERRPKQQQQRRYISGIVAESRVA